MGKPVVLPIVEKRARLEDGSMPDTPQQSTGSDGLAATWQGLADVPKAISEVRNGITALKGLISTPSAAMATGSMPASMAIAALGVELAVFIYKTEQALEHDVQAMRKTISNYQVTENDLTSATNAVLAVVQQLVTADHPTTSAGVSTAKPAGRQDRVGQLTRS